eukprot:GAFH01002102.1.p5 GENE.GAFH01002102.1~~GAFH01002102.1.p5  ORF type:complete len:67 (+),score=1.01 GAFH01002102.1:61-261(+)
MRPAPDKELPNLVIEDQNKDESSTNRCGRPGQPIGRDNHVHPGNIDQEKRNQELDQNGQEHMLVFE